jgi:hypothetical protein
MLERRPLVPEYVFAEHEWDMNPRECGLRKSYETMNPYENSESVEWATGENLARSVDVREMSINRYGSFAQSTNPTAYGADPLIGNGAGGMGPVLGPYIGKKGTPKPTVPDYVGPAGASSPMGPPEADIQLPSATRSNRTYEQYGNVTGGFVSDYGSEGVNPFVGGRASQIVGDYETWTGVTGGYVPSGADISINDPSKGARFRMPGSQGAFDPIITAGPPGGGSFGSLDVNPVDGGRVRNLINFQRIIAGGATTGMGSSLSENPQEGGRPSKLLNFQRILAGGASSGVSGLETNDVRGGNRWTRTEGFATPVSIPGRSGGYGGEISYGIEVPAKARLNDQKSSIGFSFAGAQGRGNPLAPQNFVTLPKTAYSESHQYDDSPDPVLQIAARSTIGAKSLLDFSRVNLDDLAVVVPCI